MKVKVSLMIVEIDDSDVPEFYILLDEQNSIPYKFLTTKPLEETIQEIYNKFTHLNISYANPVLSDFRLQNQEAEVLYIATVPRGISGIRQGKFVAHNSLELKDFYGRHIIQRPRNLSQQPPSR